MPYSGIIGSADFQPGQIEAGLGSWQAAASESLLPSVLLTQTQIQPAIAAEDVSFGVLALLQPGTGSYSGAVLADSPRGYFKLDELGTPGTYADSSGNGRTGTASGSLTNGATSSSGLPGTAVGFVGGATILTNAAGGTANQLTLEAWVKTSASTGYVMTSRQVSYTDGDAFTLGMGAAPVYGSAGHPFVGLDNGGVWSGVEITAANTVNNNQWHHLVGTWTGTAGAGIDWDQFKMYVDGALVPTQSVQYNTPTATSNQVAGFYIGTNGFVGSIDEAAIYGSELTAARVSAHYNAGTTYLLSLPASAVTEDHLPYASFIPGDIVVKTGTGLPWQIEDLQVSATLINSTLPLIVTAAEDFAPVVPPFPLLRPVGAADYNTSVALSAFRAFTTGVDDIAPAVDTSSWWSRNNVASASGGVVTLINNAGGALATLIEVDSTTYLMPSLGGAPLVLSAEFSITGSADEMIFGFLPSTTAATYNSSVLWDAPGFYGASLDIWNGPSVWCVDNGAGRTQQIGGVNPRSADSNTFEWWSATFTVTSSSQMSIQLKRGAASVYTWTVSKPSYTALRIAFGARTGGASGVWKVQGVGVAAGATRSLRSPGEDLAVTAALTPLLLLPTATAVEDFSTSVLTVLGYVIMSGSGGLDCTGAPAALGSIALNGSGGITNVDFVTWINLGGSGSLTTVGVKPFSPNELSGLHLWMRAKDNAGTSGTAVTTWVDQSGAGHDGVGVGGTAPTVVTEATPGLGRAVSFNAAGYFDLGAVMSRGIVITASSEGGAGYEAINVIDGNAGTRWAGSSGSVPEWLQVQMPVSVNTPATSYTIAGYAPEPAGTPGDWTVNGSNDGSMWDTLDTQTGIVFTGSTPQTFTFTNTTVYLYYQLYVTATQSPDYVRISEFSLNNMPSSAVPDGELWAVVKTGATGRGFLGASNGNYTQYYDNSGTIYEGFGNSTYQSFTATLPVNQWRIYRVAATTAGTWQAWLDGFIQKSTTGVTVNWKTNWTLGLGAANFIGSVAEILVRSQISTTPEVAAITSYLFGQHIQINNLGAVTMSALSAIDTHLPQMDIGGVSALGVGPAITVTVGQPGTLANPYPREDTDSSSVNFAHAILVAAEPVAPTGPAAAPSIWFKFTESQIASWTALTRGFVNGATINIYSGPDNATPGDLTFIATNGVLSVTLGAVTISASPAVAVSSFQFGAVNLGAVTVAAMIAIAPQRPVSLGVIAVTAVVTMASQQEVDLGAIAITVGPAVIVVVSGTLITLAGSGALVMVPVFAVTGSAGLAGLGTLDVGGLPAEADIVTLAGLGALIISGALAEATGVENLSGEGIVDAMGIPIMADNLPLSGDGIVDATGVAS